MLKARAPEAAVPPADTITTVDRNLRRLIKALRLLRQAAALN
jgi:hypothetical protein